MDTRTSNEEILEAAEPATWVGCARIDNEHYDGPTSMERLQAHHDRMDKLARVHTRLPEQIMLDAALAAERLQHEGGEDVDGLPRRAKRTSLFAIRERELLAAQDYAQARSRRGRG